MAGTVLPKALFSSEDYIPHFAKLAEAYGAIGYAVDSEEEAEDIIKKR